MSILKSIFTAIRGGASEVGESIVDSQAMRILEQEIRDSKDGIAKAKQSLAKLKAREVGCSRQLKDLQEEEAEYTDKLKQCMAADKAELAAACAEKIGELRGDIAEKQSQVDQLSGETSKLYKIIEQRQKNIEKNEIIDIASQGTMAISKWTSKLNQVVSNSPGHKEYFTNLKHAAYSKSKKILFLNRGVDVSRPLSAQNDCFWWGYQNFANLQKPYNTFVRIVRGYKSSKVNQLENAKHKIVCSLFKQPLNNQMIIAGIFNEFGDILDIFESN